LGGIVPFGVVACVQEVAVTPGELLADADLIHYTMGASEKDEEEAKATTPNAPTPPKRQPLFGQIYGLTLSAFILLHFPFSLWNPFGPR
jgi:hypothetical protein